MLVPEAWRGGTARAGQNFVEAALHQRCLLSSPQRSLQRCITGPVVVCGVSHFLFAPEGEGSVS